MGDGGGSGSRGIFLLEHINVIDELTQDNVMHDKQKSFTARLVITFLYLNFMPLVISMAQFVSTSSLISASLIWVPNVFTSSVKSASASASSARAIFLCCNALITPLRRWLKSGGAMYGSIWKKKEPWCLHPGKQISYEIFAGLLQQFLILRKLNCWLYLPFPALCYISPLFFSLWLPFLDKPLPRTAPLAVPNLYYTCVFLHLGYAYLCSAVLVAAYSVSFSYLLFCTFPPRGYTYLSI